MRTSGVDAVPGTKNGCMLIPVYLAKLSCSSMNSQSGLRWFWGTDAILLG